jgi:hypothetical protein
VERLPSRSRSRTVPPAQSQSRTTSLLLDLPEHLYYFNPTSFAFPACTKLARNIRADNTKRLPLPTKNYEPVSSSTIDHLSTQTSQRAIPFHYHPETNPATGMFLSRLQKTSSSCPPQQQRNHQDKPSKPAGPKQAACKRQRTA